MTTLTTVSTSSAVPARWQAQLSAQYPYGWSCVLPPLSYVATFTATGDGCPKPYYGFSEDACVLTRAIASPVTFSCVGSFSTTITTTVNGGTLTASDQSAVTRMTGTASSTQYATTVQTKRITVSVTMSVDITTNNAEARKFMAKRKMGPKNEHFHGLLVPRSARVTLNEPHKKLVKGVWFNGKRRAETASSSQPATPPDIYKRACLRVSCANGLCCDNTGFPYCYGVSSSEAKCCSGPICAQINWAAPYNTYVLANSASTSTFTDRRTTYYTTHVPSDTIYVQAGEIAIETVTSTRSLYETINILPTTVWTTRTSLVTSTAVVPRPTFMGQALLTGTCTSVHWTVLPFENGKLIELPLVGCSREQQKCCPPPDDGVVGGHALGSSDPVLNELENNRLPRCPADYHTIGSVCCPSGFILFSDAIDNNMAKQTPCQSPISTNFNLPTEAAQSLSSQIASITSAAVNATLVVQVFVIDSYVWALSIPVQPSSKGLSTGERVNVSVSAGLGALVLLALGILGYFLLRRRKRTHGGDENREVNSVPKGGFSAAQVASPAIPLVAVGGPTVAIAQVVSSSRPLDVDDGHMVTITQRNSSPVLSLPSDISPRNASDGHGYSFGSHPSLGSGQVLLPQNEESGTNAYHSIGGYQRHHSLECPAHGSDIDSSGDYGHVPNG